MIYGRASLNGHTSELPPVDYDWRHLFILRAVACIMGARNGD